MCTSLPCRTSATTTTCVFTDGIGAAIGSTCSSGKICDQYECVTNDIAPTGTCLFGDDVVTNLNSGLPFLLPKEQNTCEDTITFISSQNQFPIAFCATNTNFKATCCQTCQRNYF